MIFYWIMWITFILFIMASFNAFNLGLIGIKFNRALIFTSFISGILAIDSLRKVAVDKDMLIPLYLTMFLISMFAIFALIGMIKNDTKAKEVFSLLPEEYELKSELNYSNEMWRSDNYITFDNNVILSPIALENNKKKIKIHAVKVGEDENYKFYQSIALEDKSSVTFSKCISIFKSLSMIIAILVTIWLVGELMTKPYTLPLGEESLEYKLFAGSISVVTLGGIEKIMGNNVLRKIYAVMYYMVLISFFVAILELFGL